MRRNGDATHDCFASLELIQKPESQGVRIFLILVPCLAFSIDSSNTKRPGPIPGFLASEFHFRLACPT
jgi:hypothetical protein